MSVSTTTTRRRVMIVGREDRLDVSGRGDRDVGALNEGRRPLPVAAAPQSSHEAALMVNACRPHSLALRVRIRATRPALSEGPRFTAAARAPHAARNPRLWNRFYAQWNRLHCAKAREDRRMSQVKKDGSNHQDAHEVAVRFAKLDRRLGAGVREYRPAPGHPTDELILVSVKACPQATREYKKRRY